MKREQDKNGNMFYRQERCPVCKSKNRHFEHISNKAIKAGVVEKDYVRSFQQVSSMLGDKDKVAALPIGGEIPSIQVATEICMDCGCVYATVVIVGRAQKALMPAKIWKPGDPT